MPRGAKPKNMQLEMEVNRRMNDAAHAKRKLMQTFKNEKQVPVKISPMYQPYFGKTMPVSLNGLTIYVKVNGSVQYVPRSFADIIEERIMNIDRMLTKQHRMANIQENFESSPGELKIF